MNSENSQHGFKMTEIGLLPEEWEVVRLQEAFNFTQKPKNVIIKNFDKIPFIPMENIPLEEIYATKIDLKNPAEIKTGTFFENGDLLVAKITPSFENGKQCIIENVENKFGYATTEVWPIKKTKHSDVLFLFFYLKKGDVRKYIAGKMEGSTGRQRVPKHVLSNLIIPLPPLSEQKQIAAVLSGVQEAREKTEAVIAAAKELKKSLMKYLFTYGPVPVVEVDKVRLKETEIGLVPEEWELKQLISTFKLSSGKTRPSDLSPIQSEDFVYPVYGGNGVMGYSKEYLINNKTVVLGRVGEYCGSVHISEPKSWVSDNALYATEFLNNDYVLEFLAIALERLNLNRLKKKSGQPLITQSIVYSQFVPYPQKIIQQKMIAIMAQID